MSLCDQNGYACPPRGNSGFWAAYGIMAGNPEWMGAKSVVGGCGCTPEIALPVNRRMCNMPRLIVHGLHGEGKDESEKRKLNSPKMEESASGLL